MNDAPRYYRDFKLDGLPPNTLPDDLVFVGECKHGDNVTLVGYLNFGDAVKDEVTGEWSGWKFVRTERNICGVLFTYAMNWFIQSDIVYGVWNSHIVKKGLHKTVDVNYG